MRRCIAELPELTCRVYAPVGGYADLLAYLVRRLLENGANSSFVSVAADPNVPIAEILKRPQAWIGDPRHARHSHIPLPRDLFAPERRNSSGVEFGDRAALDALAGRDRGGTAAWRGRAADRRRRRARPRPRCRVADRWRASSARCRKATRRIVASAMAAAQAGFAAWDATPASMRARRLLDARRRSDRAKSRAG